MTALIRVAAIELAVEGLWTAGPLVPMTVSHNAVHVMDLR